MNEKKKANEAAQQQSTEAPKTRRIVVEPLPGTQPYKELMKKMKIEKRD